MSPVDLRTYNARAFGQAVANINALLFAARMGERKALGKFVMHVHAEMVRELSHPGTGRIYRIDRDGGGKDDERSESVRYHQASAPGEPPAPTTGAYRASWWWRMSADAQGLVGEVGTNSELGPWLEYGTRHMAPRPHLRPVVLRTADELTADVVAGILEAERAAMSGMPGVPGPVGD